MKYQTNDKSIEFANKVIDVVQEKYKKFLIASDLYEIGCTSEEKVIEEYENFKSSVDKCTIINSKLIYFN